MSDYTVTTDFLAKDALAPGNPSKKVKGAEFDVEFDNIATAIATKANANNPALTGTVSIGGVNLTVTANELNYLAGVTSAVQTQLNAKLASASYTAADVLAKLLTVDGAGSGLDADTLDGYSSAAFALLAGSTFTGAVAVNKNGGGSYSGSALSLSGSFGGGVDLTDSGYGKGAMYLSSGSLVLKAWNDSASSAQSLTISNNGTATFTNSVTATDFIISSDARLKQNVRLICNAGQIVDSLNGYRFEWKDSGKARVGVIAQEVQQVLPEIVHEGDDGYLRVSEGALSAVLIEEVKSLRQRVAALESR